MRAVVQRVARARVTVDDEVVGQIGEGLVVLLGIGEGDGPGDAAYLADRVANLRIFPDDVGKMNLSVLDAGGAALVISQFTLYGDCRGGRRPSFTKAASPGAAESLYGDFVRQLEDAGLEVATGEFGAMMMVSLDNWGPVTLLLDSGKNF
ncbi:MAG: D-aminoacyl-tRNA deacylase [Bacillota bacterium]